MGALFWASFLAADEVKLAVAGAAPRAKITDVLFLELAPVPPAQQAARGSRAKLVSVVPKVRFLLAIKGESLPCSTTPDVLLQTQDPGQPVEIQKALCVNQGEVDVSGIAPVGTVITSVKVTTGGCKATPGTPPQNAAPGATATITSATATIATAPVVLSSGRCSAASGKDSTAADSCNTATSSGLTISIKAIPPESALQEFGIKFDHRQSKEFPNLHSLLVTKTSGEVGVGFDANPNRMSVDLEPTGATDLRVVQSNEEQLELHFVAAADYVPANVIVTVYTGSDLDKRRPRFVGKAAPAPQPPAADPNAPAITSVETVFLDRHDGNGRVRIFGKGFGKGFKPPPYPVDDFLCDCLERLPQKLNWARTCGTFRIQPRSSRQLDEAARRRLTENQRKQRLQEEEEDLTRLETNRRAYCGLPVEAAKLRSEERADGDVETGEIVAGGRLDAWLQWQCELGVTAAVSARNPDIRVERTRIIAINDEMVDVYFEFTRRPGYAWPMRLAGVDLTIPGTARKVEQVVALPSAKATAEVDAAAPTMIHLSSAIGPKPDDNLTYRYTVLSYREVQRLLGDGVADNFHVVELAVVNDGSKKVAIPLAGMQAEIEWLYGPDKSAGYPNGFFLEGPVTLPPVPMSTVSAYFGASKKNSEKRVKVFNILEGITTLVGALIPFAGPGLKDAEVVFSSGFIPGLRHAWGDITDQQLQNLTTLSWQTSETLAASGGSMQKLIYFQSGEQFEDDQEDILSPPALTEQQMSNILAIEVTGYEIDDTPAKAATPAGKSPTAPARKTAKTTADATGATTGTTTSESTSPPPP